MWESLRFLSLEESYSLPFWINGDSGSSGKILGNHSSIEVFIEVTSLTSESWTIRDINANKVVRIIILVKSILIFENSKLKS